MKADIYSKGIDYLVENPGSIFSHWNGAVFPGRSLLPEYALFSLCSPSKSWKVPAGCSRMCGCLTMIRSGKSPGWTPELTEQIRNDRRLPSNMTEFKARFKKANKARRRKMLEPFAEWQRRLDKELGRTV